MLLRNVALVSRTTRHYISEVERFIFAAVRTSNPKHEEVSDRRLYLILRHSNPYKLFRLFRATSHTAGFHTGSYRDLRIKSKCSYRYI
jgi:hypothetical protein